MQNHLYFIPCADEPEQKKTFFFFEYVHQGFFKSDQVGSTDRAAAMIKCALEESQRHIVIDTGTVSGRNLLHRVLPLVEEHGLHRCSVASLFRQQQGLLQDYWDNWGTLSLDRKKTQDEIFVKMFSAPKTQGGMRPLTPMDILAVRVSKMAEEEIDTAAATELFNHPIALCLRVVLREIAKVQSAHVTAHGYEAYETEVVNITHCMLRLLQDPFPLEDSEDAYRRSCTRLFEAALSETDKDELTVKSLESMVFNVISGEGKDRDVLKKKSRDLWSLIIQARKCVDGLTGNASRKGAVDTVGVFRKGFFFEQKVLMLLDILMDAWTESLVSNYSGQSLNFIDHEIFSQRFAPAVKEQCKKLFVLE